MITEIFPPHGWFKTETASKSKTTFYGWNSGSSLPTLKAIGARLGFVAILGTFLLLPFRNTHSEALIEGLILAFATVTITLGFAFRLTLKGNKIGLVKTWYFIPLRFFRVPLDSIERIKIGFHWNKPDSNWLGLRDKLELSQLAPKDMYVSTDPKIFFGSPVSLTQLGTAVKEAIQEHLNRIEKERPEKDTELLLALRRAEPLDAIKRRVTEGASLKTESVFGRTLLHYACQFYSTPEVALFLLDSKVDFEARDNFGETALALAIRAGKLEIARLLISRGADVHVRNYVAQNLLHLAALSPYPAIKPIIPELIEKGIPLTERDEQKNLALHYAAGWIGDKSENVMAWFLTKPEIISSKNKLGRTPLHFAAKSGLQANIKLLLSVGADPAARDRDGYMAAEVGSVHHLQTQVPQS